MSTEHRLCLAAEKEIAKKLFATEGVSKRQASEDLLWALINTPEFVYKD